MLHWCPDQFQYPRQKLMHMIVNLNHVDCDDEDGNYDEDDHDEDDHDDDSDDQDDYSSNSVNFQARTSKFCMDVYPLNA